VAAGIGKQADRTDGACAGDYRHCLNKNAFHVSRGTTGKQILVRRDRFFCLFYVKGEGQRDTLWRGYNLSIFNPARWILMNRGK